MTASSGELTIEASTATRQAPCPDCGTVSAHVHGHYQRRLQDTPIGGQPATIHLRVHRFRCASTACERRTFAEQVDGLTRPYARRTPHHHQALEAIALSLVGRPGARLARTLCAPTSPNSLIRILHARPDEPPSSVPRVLGVDDFALKRRHVYATILLDMETGRRVDVLPDRTADTFAAWLRDHPGVEIVCRDRASAYAEAVRSAAPEAVQVADRFHLWKNLCEAVDKCVAAHRDCLAEPAAEPAQTDTEPTPAPAAMEGVRAAQRRERHTAVHALLDKGLGISAIADALGFDRKTVRRYAHAPTPQDLPVGEGRRGTLIQPYLAYLHQRWNEGRTDAVRLCAEIREQGYQGSERTVRRHLEPLRSSGRPAPPAPEALTVRQATGLITSLPSRLKPKQEVKLKELLGRCPELDRVAGCVRSFATMMREKKGQDLEAWLATAEATEMQPVQSFVRGLRQDFDAVTAGLTLEWSSGRVEGNVCRIKALK
ncbi:ISL3 family transposase, partial [Nocardiopsis sp. N85]|uniref:ISL3 family transposase n=1 Tax=Nocardiopsis sp. N85 TaxID=3029400 RepID=UPI00237F07D0